jgi:hypothetical protein
LATLFRHVHGVIQTFDQFAARGEIVAANCIFGLAHGGFLIEETGLELNDKLNTASIRPAARINKGNPRCRNSSVFGPIGSMPIFSF